MFDVDFFFTFFGQFPGDPPECIKIVLSIFCCHFSIDRRFYRVCRAGPLQQLCVNAYEYVTRMAIDMTSFCVYVAGGTGLDVCAYMFPMADMHEVS